MNEPRLDYLGDPLPAGYEPWTCDTCTAGCNFEAMQMCAGGPCPFDRDKPESNFGCFAFIIKPPKKEALSCTLDPATT